MLTTISTFDIDLNKNTPKIKTKVDFTTYRNQPRMLIGIGEHIMELHFTPEMVQEFLKIVGGDEDAKLDK